MRDTEASTSTNGRSIDSGRRYGKMGWLGWPYLVDSHFSTESATEHFADLPALLKCGFGLAIDQSADPSVAHIDKSGYESLFVATFLN